MPPRKAAWSKIASNNNEPGSQSASPAQGAKSPQKATKNAANPTMTNYDEIQKNEVEVLRSIYMDDFEDVSVKPGAWNKSAELSFSLHLKAPSNPQVKVALAVKLPSTYPKTAPNLSLSAFDSLRQKTRDEIRSFVAAKPKYLLGSEMIFELASTIQDMLEDDAQARAQAAESAMPSLEEERMVREAAANQVAKEAKEEMVRKKEAVAAEEERMLGQLVEEEVKRRQERVRVARKKSTAQDNEKPVEPDIDQSDTVVFDQPVVFKDDRGRSASFRAVYGKTLVSKSGSSEVSTVKPIVSGNGVNAPLLLLKEIVLEPRGTDESQFREKLRSSEEKLEALKSLRHPNIVDFLNFRIYRAVDSDDTSGSWNVAVLLEFANKGSLFELLDIAESVGAANIRSWTIQLLEGLNYYHRHGIVHENIHCGNIMLFRPQSGSTVVKLSDGFQRTLPCPSRETKFTSSTSPSWLSPELAQDSARRTVKTDVWDLGIVFLQMAFGKDVLLQYASPNALIGAHDLSDSLETMICQLFRVDPKKRPTAFDLLPSEFLRDNAPLLVTSSISNSLVSTRPNRVRHDSTNVLGSLSRYASDFVEAGRLGKGGFGEVVKARNKIDGRFYAVKKIPQLSTSTDTLQEIMLLSQLNHPYVVRYFTAWLEHDYSIPQDGSEDAITSTEDVSTASAKDNVEFGFSTGGLDFISSSGYPKVQFGYDNGDENREDEDAEESEDEEPESSTGNSKNPRHVRSVSEVRPLRSILYIQMEYCEKHTLRDLIRNQLSENADEVWRLFRQILDGLSHIHKHHIIHRDLKPDNIFIDLGNNPRIGDFGLATSGQFSTVVKSSSATDAGGNMTRSIGTTFYVAPELKSAGAGQYNEKVDMYSLGIIFFEMCYPLGTGMERVTVLRAIREKDHILPKVFQSPEHALQGDIIMSLLHHKPSERPSSNDLLQSGKLPLQVEDEIFRKALLGISDSDSPQYQKILSAMFSQPAKKVQESAWDRQASGPQSPGDILLSSMVKDRLTSLFRRHGAMETKRQLLFPRSEQYSGNVVRLLDPNGTVLQLPYDFTVPNARSIVRGELLSDKSFFYGTVYRELPQGGEPARHGEVDFDIVSPDTSDLALKEAEVIKVLDEITLEFPPLKSAQMCFHLNHSDLLELIMDFCHVDLPQRPVVEEIISTLNVGHWTWQKIRNKLRSPLISIPSTSLDDLARFDFRETIDKTLQKLSVILEGTPYLERLNPIFTHLNAVSTYMKRLKVKRKVYINPLSSYNNKFYKGNILFQCLYDTKRRDVFAAGGRYDRLIQEVSKTSSVRSQAHAVGFNLKFDSLCASMSNYVNNTGKTFLKQGDAELQGLWKARKCDVLVGSFDATILRTTGIEILQELWANDISAELAGDKSSLEDLLSGTKDDGHSWIINVRHDASAVGERSLKIKSIVKDEDFDVRPSELTAWLRVEIRDRGRREGTSEGTKLFRPTSHQDGGASMAERDVEVRVLSTQHRGKKQNRRNIVESAQLRSQELVRTFLDGPIAAIETKDDILEAIADTRLSDPDSWRKMINNAPAPERQYLGQVHELLLDMAKGSKNGTRNAFVFNFRTGSCIYYDLGRQAS